MKFEPPTRRYGAYLFDFDGTLVDSMPLHYQGWVYSLAQMGLDFTFPTDLFLAWAGTETDRIVQRLNDRFNVSIDIAALMQGKREYFEDNVHRLQRLDPVCDWAFEVATHAPTAIVTGGYRDMVQASMVPTRMDGLSQHLITFQDVENGKPAPDMFLLAAERLGVDPKDCLVIEDGESGVEGARAAGMDTLFIDRVPDLAGFGQ